LISWTQFLRAQACGMIAECLDWVIIWNRRHLERVLTNYIEHDNTATPRRSINLEVPFPAAHAAPSPRNPPSRVERVDVRGLVHEYRQAA
jgi:hypothetical protein